MFFFHFLIPSLHISSKDFSFPDPGELPTPVLMVQELGFAYPGCAKLYDGVEFGIDLQSRVALVGPNGAGKTTLVLTHGPWAARVDFDPPCFMLRN